MVPCKDYPLLAELQSRHDEGIRTIRQTPCQEDVHKSIGLFADAIVDILYLLLLDMHKEWQ
jgi:hypothetical protein